MNYLNILKNKIALNRKKMLMLLIIAICSLTAFAGVGFSLQHKKESAIAALSAKEKIVAPLAEDNRTLKKLTEIEDRLTRLQSKIELQKQPEIDLNPLNTGLSSLSQEVKLASQASNSAITQQIDSSYKTLSVEMNALKEEINQLRQKENKSKWLPISELPFRVLSIDSIQQENVVSIDYHFKTIPIEKGDSLVGWTLVKASFSKGRAEFVNAKKERVMVKVKDIG